MKQINPTKVNHPHSPTVKKLTRDAAKKTIPTTVRTFLLSISMIEYNSETCFKKSANLFGLLLARLLCLVAVVKYHPL